MLLLLSSNETSRSPSTAVNRAAASFQSNHQATYRKLRCQRRVRSEMLLEELPLW
jgi:hypothetical protein